MKRVIRAITISLLSMVTLTAWANAPIVDLTQNNQSKQNQSKQNQSKHIQSQAGQSKQKELLDFNRSPAKHQYVSAQSSDKEQLSRLRNKMNNLVQMNLPGQIDQIKQKIQDLQGQLDTLEHRQDKLQKRQQRLSQALNNHSQKAESANSNGQAQNSGQTSRSSQNQQSSSSDTKKQVEHAYRQAFLALHQQQYDSARTKFETFIKQHPDTPYTAGAYYWLGELYYVKGNAKKAKKALNNVLNKFSDSEKVPAAKLKLALIALDEGDKQKAQKQMRQIKQHYPKSSAAKLAKRYLQQMNNT